MKIAVAVITGIIGFSAMLIYISGIGYLVFRKNTKIIQPLLSEDSEFGRRLERCDEDETNLPRQDIVNLQLPKRSSSAE